MRGQTKSQRDLRADTDRERERDGATEILVASLSLSYHGVSQGFSGESAEVTLTGSSCPAGL